MIRLVASAVIGLLSNAVALIVGSLVLDQFSLGASGFIMALLIFTGVSVLIEPLIRQVALTKAPALRGSTALLAVLVSLVVTALATESLSIDGLGTWVAAVVIVWIVSLAATMLLPLVIFRKVLSERRGD